MRAVSHTARTRLTQMYLIVALCLLCGWVVPHACRSVDVRDPPSEDLEPFVSHHHHEGNIAELLIPLLERSLAQSEARTNERQHRRSKAGKKVIQVLPYRGSEEHKRKGWRKLNSHKKQVVEITPLHGKNRAKPLAYILSAAKPSHAEHAETNDDVSTSNTSELEHDKSTSEEQQSSEENRDNSEDVNVNTLRTGDGDSPGDSNNVQSSEDAYTRESKDLSASDKESADATVESDVTAERSEERKVVVVEESEEYSPISVKFGKHTHHDHHRKSYATVETATIEEDATVEDAEDTMEDVGSRVEDATATIEGNEATVEDVSAIIVNRAATVEAIDATVESADATVENKDVTVEDLGTTNEDVGVTVEQKSVTVEDVEVTVEDRAVTVEDVEVTVEDRAATVEEESATVEENVTAEDKASTIENDAETVEDQLAVEDDASIERTATVEMDATIENAEVTVEDDANVERAATVEDNDTHLRKAHVHTHQHHVENDVSDINHLIDTIGRDTMIENEDSSEHSRGGYIDNDIVISRGQPESDSAEKSINKLFNARARDIIELIQSSVETSTSAHRDCLGSGDKHHDHKSYRLSFLFNK